MTKWYERMGNTIEINIGEQWIKGTVIDGYRTGDGIVTMETLDGKKIWCGSGMENVVFRKCDDSLKDLTTNADRIRSMIMSNEGLAKFITSGEMCAICPFCQYYGTEQCYIENEGVHKNCDSGIMEWLQSEAEE